MDGDINSIFSTSENLRKINQKFMFLIFNYVKNIIFHTTYIFNLCKMEKDQSNFFLHKLIYELGPIARKFKYNGSNLLIIVR